jgi:hypothetical protein
MQKNYTEMFSQWGKIKCKTIFFLAQWNFIEPRRFIPKPSVSLRNKTLARYVEEWKFVENI